MDTTLTGRRIAAAVVAGAFGLAAPLTFTTLAHAAVHGSSHSRDSDGDKMPNRWESRHGLNAHKANAHRDADHDGLVNLAEYRDGTDPQDDDTDDDGIEDGDDDSPDCAVTPPTGSPTTRHDGTGVSDDCVAEQCDDDSTSSSDDQSDDDQSDDDCDDVAPAP